LVLVEIILHPIAGKSSNQSSELRHQDWGAPSPSPGSIVGGEETQEEREEEIE